MAAHSDESYHIIYSAAYPTIQHLYMELSTTVEASSRSPFAGVKLLTSEPAWNRSCRAQECKKYPQLAEIAARVPPGAMLTKEEFQGHLSELDKSLRSLPATAQAVLPPIDHDYSV